MTAGAGSVPVPAPGPTPAVAASGEPSIRALLAARLGLQLDHIDDAALQAVLQRRLAATRLAPGAWLARLQADPAEAAALAPELTVAETYFFRHAEHFDALCEFAPTGAAAAGLRILCAGCASGEEAYSIAIVLRERGLAAPAIRAIDVNAALIAQARRGRYGAWALREAAATRRLRWFRPDAAHWQLDDSLRAAVSFETGNLCDDDPLLWAEGGYDVVFCRNVLMYFTPAQAARLVARIQRALRPGGLLFLGHAETLRGLTSDFALREGKGCFFYQRLPLTLTAARRGRVPGASSDGTDWWTAIAGASARIDALTRGAQAPASVSAATVRDEAPLAAARALIHREAFGAALAAIEALPPAAHDAGEARLLQALALTQSGRLAEAEACCHRLLLADAGDAAARYLLALCREAAGDGDAAARCASDAARFDPGFALPRLQLARLARRRGDLALVRDELGRALALLPGDDAPRLQLFSAGFDRAALIALTRRELDATPAVRGVA